MTTPDDNAARGAPARDGTPGEIPVRRALDSLTTVAIAASLVLVLIAAAPSIARALGVGERPQVAVANPIELAPSSKPDAPKFSFEDDDDDDDGRIEHDPHGRPRDPRDPFVDRGGAREPRELHGQRGRTIHPTALRDAPEGDEVAMVAAGQTIVVLKSQGDWALVAFQGGESVTMGWAKKSEISVQ